MIKGERGRAAGPGAWAVFPWKTFNRILYKAYYLGRNLPVFSRSGRWTRAFAAENGPPRGQGEILVLSWGRMGDTILSLSFLAGLEGIFPGRRITWVGRRETAFLLEGRVHEFLPFSPGEWRTSRAFRERFLRSVWREWDILAGDLHLFFGGLFYFHALIELLPARRKYLYQGYAPPPDLAPRRPFPEGITLVPPLGKDFSRKGDPEELHVLLDQEFYLSALAGDQEEGETGFPGGDWSFPPVGEGKDLGALERDLPPGPFILVQAGSNSPRRRYPPQGWRALFSAFPGETFLLLGTAGEAGPPGAPLPGNVRDLRGRTSLEDCARLMRRARAFVGLDSGLVHLAAHLGTPALCLAQSSNLGFFVPYPQRYEKAELKVLSHPEFRECSGCMMVCSREFLGRNYLQGLPCLRSIPAGRVIEGLRDLL